MLPTCIMPVDVQKKHTSLFVSTKNDYGNCDDHGEVVPFSTRLGRLAGKVDQTFDACAERREILWSMDAQEFVHTRVSFTRVNVRSATGLLQFHAGPCRSPSLLVKKRVKKYGRRRTPLRTLYVLTLSSRSIWMVVCFWWNVIYLENYR